MNTNLDGGHYATSGSRSDQVSRLQNNTGRDYPLLAWVADELRMVDSLKSENELIQNARALMRDALNGATTLADSAVAPASNLCRRKIA